MVEVKICGLTRPSDAECADSAGASFLGVIFAGGPRQSAPSQARETLAGCHARKVGVFARQEPREIADVARVVGLDIIQLHDAVVPERVRSVRLATGLEVWAVIRTPDGTLPADTDQLADEADALVVDALVPGQLGGSGVVIPWLRLGESLDALERGHRVVLAGGLTPENVTEAIDYVSPMVVDVSSGVESAPGFKDHARVLAFIAAARTAGNP